ncbi:helix-turn-helix transcriptional regulator [Lacicoccus alkaliphilus]|uniref:DNA-binding transcriptional regulator, XRE-family HTH domain n=1 Tax=Lacicoccus alkaliphilus DSM 16010 TaxID=1123231 RepID=A0A1M7KKJ0_9BACL|nr:DNA-binding transcriptional regulator, XRE-family HTH domain [Salinicoccus alkaliphilus DSM 16010]
MESFSNSKLKSNLSIILYHFRIEYNLTRKAMASILSISLNALTSIENGKSTPTLETLYKYALNFDTTISKIIERAENYE